MRATELKKYKRRLIEQRQKLTGTLSSMQSQALKPAGGGRDVDEMADLGSDEFEQEMTLGLIENNQDVIDQIDRALDRIEDGSFGRCAECGGKIPKARLDAIPMAAHCVDCQAKMEELRSR